MTKLNIHKPGKVPEDSLMARMAVEIAVNPQGRLWVLHDRSFDAQLLHLLYDDESGDVFFVFDNEEIVHLGMSVPDKLRPSFRKAEDADCILLQDNSEGKKEIAGFQKIPLRRTQESEG